MTPPKGLNLPRYFINPGLSRTWKHRRRHDTQEKIRWLTSGGRIPRRQLWTMPRSRARLQAHISSIDIFQIFATRGHRGRSRVHVVFKWMSSHQLYSKSRITTNRTKVDRVAWSLRGGAFARIRRGVLRSGGACPWCLASLWPNETAWKSRLGRERMPWGADKERDRMKNMLS